MRQICSPWKLNDTPTQRLVRELPKRITRRVVRIYVVQRKYNVTCIPHGRPKNCMVPRTVVPESKARAGTRAYFVHTTYIVQYAQLPGNSSQPGRHYREHLPSFLRRVILHRGQERPATQILRRRCTDRTHGTLSCTAPNPGEAIHETLRTVQGQQRLSSVLRSTSWSRVTHVNTNGIAGRGGRVR